MPAIIIINYAIAFALETGAIVIAGMWSFHRGDGGVPGWVLALVAVAVVIGLWAWLAAPKSTTRLDMPWLLLFKIAVFGAATLMLWPVSGWNVALGFGVLSVLHLGLAAGTGRV